MEDDEKQKKYKEDGVKMNRISKLRRKKNKMNLRRISTMSIFMRSLLVAFALVAILSFSPRSGKAQVIKPSGTLDRVSSQLILWYDEANVGGGEIALDVRDSYLQVTNTHASEGVWIHVQVYRSFLIEEGVTRCAEIDFVDYLTERDTHVYEMDEVYANSGTFIGSFEGTKGFVIITPIAAQNDNRPISWQHLIGTSEVVDVDDNTLYRIRAMGRDAVDFTTGDVVADGTVLDGSANGFVVLQPSELFFNYNNLTFLSGNMDIIGITFIDEYNDDPTLGYRAKAGSTNWSPYTHDSVENRFSCTPLENACFNNFGYNADNTGDGVDVPVDDFLLGDPDICNGVGINVDYSFFTTTTWTRLLVSGYDSFENQLGIRVHNNNNFIGEGFGGAEWMNAVSE